MKNKKLILALMLIFIFGITGMNNFAKEKSPVPKKALKLEKKADKAKDKKEFETALELYKNALEIYPDNAGIHYKIASIYAFNKKYPEALKELKLAKGINKEDTKIIKAYVDTIIRYGQSLLNERKVKEANAQFIEITNIPGYDQVEPKLINEMFYRIGFNYFSLKDTGKSNEFLLKFVKNPASQTDFPKFFSTATYLVGLNFTQLNDLENSNSYLEKYVDINKENPEDRYLPFAKYVLGTNNFKALEKKVKELEKGSNRKNMKQIKKKVIDLASKTEGIEDNLLFATGKNPQLEGAYVILGNYYYLKNDLDSSLKYYKLLTEKFPKSLDIEVYKVFLKDLERQKKGK